MFTKEVLLNLKDEISIANMNLEGYKDKEINKIEFINLVEGNLLKAMNLVNELSEK